MTSPKLPPRYPGVAIALAELLAQAASLVQRNPKLRAMAEREERELEREQRKRARNGVLELPVS